MPGLFILKKKLEYKGRKLGHELHEVTLSTNLTENILKPPLQLIKNSNHFFLPYIFWWLGCIEIKVEMLKEQSAKFS